MDSEKEITPKIFNNLIQECEDGNLKEVKILLDKYDFLTYLKENIIPVDEDKDDYERTCPVCTCVYSNKNEVLTELLDRGFYADGMCYQDGTCTMPGAISGRYEDIVETLIVNGGTWYDERNQENISNSDMVDYLQDVVRITCSIIKKNGEKVNLKPAKK